VRQNYNTGNWDTFNELLKRDTNGYIPFFYPNQEILPPKQGIWVFHNQARVDISSIDQELIPKLVVESQLLNMRYFAKKNKGKIICTGGASKNDAILGIMASVFGMPVYRMETENAAALGGCYRAKY
jgi:sugar (pentulose or hexulose) kinase